MVFINEPIRSTSSTLRCVLLAIWVLMLPAVLHSAISHGYLKINRTPNSSKKVFYEDDVIFVEIFIGGCLVLMLLLLIALFVICVFCYQRRSSGSSLCRNCTLRGWKDEGGVVGVARKGDGLDQHITQRCDNKLALSAQRFHYQLHKEKVIALEREKNDQLDSEMTSEIDKNGGGHMKIYQYPGLEMIKMCESIEVANPGWEDGEDTSVGDSTCHDVADDVFSDDYNDVIDHTDVTDHGRHTQTNDVIDKQIERHLVAENLINNH